MTPGPSDAVDGGATLVVGEALIDIVHPVGDPDGPGAEFVGGSPANVAIGLSALDHPTRLLTHLGDDERGERIRTHVRERGVALEAGTPAERTPTAEVTLDVAGVAEYRFDLTWQIPVTLPDGVDHLHTGSIAATLEPGASSVRALVEQARAVATVSYDPNVRPGVMGEPHDARQAIEQLVGLSDVVKASEEDLSRLYGIDEHDPDALRTLAGLWSRLGPGLVVITLGPDGSLVTVAGGAATAHEPISEIVPGRPVDVVDTVGAGDSFMAGLISGLRDAGLLGGVEARRRLRDTTLDDVRPAVERAIASSAWTVQQAGASAPTRAQV